MARKLVAALACRSQGSRLYGKPLQNLDVDRGIRIIDNILDCLTGVEAIDEVVLGISEGVENLAYRELAEARGLRWIIGDQKDVLGRLIACGDLAGATDIFRVTSESPFPGFDRIDAAWGRVIEEEADGLFFDDIVDGCGFEIISLAALKQSHRDGEDRHRSEFCTQYVRENNHLFRILREVAPEPLVRKDLRLTVDNPEDLVLARAVFAAFADRAPRIPVADIVAFLDTRPDLVALTAPYAEAGYGTMYVWGDKEGVDQ